MTNEEKKALVLDYVNRRRKMNSILVFSLTNIPEINYNSNEDLVMEILKGTTKNCSYNIKSKCLETFPNRYRTSLDIYRHCKFYNSEITILDVMDILSNETFKVGSWFCGDIRKRVFFVFGDNDSRVLHNSYCYRIQDKNHKDEYGLLFEDWEGINKD